VSFFVFSFDFVTAKNMPGQLFPEGGEVNADINELGMVGAAME